MSEAASESGRLSEPSESASPGASFGTPALPMSSSSYVTLPGGPLPTSPGAPVVTVQLPEIAS